MIFGTFSGFLWVKYLVSLYLHLQKIVVSKIYFTEIFKANHKSSYSVQEVALYSDSFT